MGCLETFYDFPIKTESFQYLSDTLCIYKVSTPPPTPPLQQHCQGGQDLSSRTWVRKDKDWNSTFLLQDFVWKNVPMVNVYVDGSVRMKATLEMQLR